MCFAFLNLISFTPVYFVFGFFAAAHAFVAYGRLVERHIAARSLELFFDFIFAIAFAAPHGKSEVSRIYRVAEFLHCLHRFNVAVTEFERGLIHVFVNFF